MIKNKMKFLVTGIIATILFGCRFPYEPSPEPGIMTTNIDTKSQVRVFPVNGTEQICNPSISQDTGRFAGSMLWLNFSGNLSVVYPDSLKKYDERTLQHDRLMVVDSANTVRWCIKVNEVGADEKNETFQDPEWTTHSEYCICLLSAEKQKKWGGFVIHMSTKNCFNICREGLDETSTPHLWIDKKESVPGALTTAITYDVDYFADTTSIHSFFGTKKVKMVVSLKKAGIQSIFLKDYTVSGSKLISLQRPVDRDGWNCESPLISPDGKWIVFNAFKEEEFYETYIQELRVGAKPVLLASRASDPHWWIHPNDSSLVYIVYQEVPDVNFVSGDLTDKKYQLTGELGYTYRQMVRLFTNTQTTSVAIIKPSPRELLVSLPTKGGLSPDGRYLCTGFERAFILGLP